MLDTYVIFLFFATHGHDSVLEECFPKYVPWNTSYPRCPIELKDSGDKYIWEILQTIPQMDILICRVLEKTLCLN